MRCVLDMILPLFVIDLKEPNESSPAVSSSPYRGKLLAGAGHGSYAGNGGKWMNGLRWRRDFITKMMLDLSKM